MMTYKGYAGRLEIDPDAEVIHGRVIGIRDVITFEGGSIEEVKQAFRDSVDDYLDFCKELGRPPEKPRSGTLNVRLGAELHRLLSVLAEVDEVSINEKLRQLAENAVRERLGASPVIHSAGRTAKPARSAKKKAKAPRRKDAPATKDTGRKQTKAVEAASVGQRGKETK